MAWRRRGVGVAGLAVAGVLLTVVLPEIAAYVTAWRPLAVHVELKRAEDCDWLVLVARRQERTREDETTVPFRNSPLAFYHRTEQRWTKISRDFLSRSISTAPSAPSAADSPEIARQCLRKSTKFMCGYESLPYGFYSLAPAQLRGKSAFLISDWERADGKIVLDIPQTLRTFFADASSSESVLLEDVSARQMSLEKDQCFLHGTLTRNWSFQDALGCITLFHPNEPKPGEISDWKEFLDILQRSAGHGTTSTVGLLVLPQEEILSGDAASLPPVIPSSLTSRLSSNLKSSTEAAP